MDSLPALTRLQLGIHFNQPIDHLPSSLIHLYFPYASSFNHSVDHLPASLQTLTFAGAFNRPVDHLPQFLIVLAFKGSKFNQPLHHLPPFLQELTIWSVFSEGITLPPSLQEFNAPNNYKTPFLPAGLQRLFIENASGLKVLPPTLRELCADGATLEHLEAFPPTLEELHIFPPVAGPLHTIPAKCIIYLSSPVQALHSIPDHIRRNVRHLTFDQLHSSELLLSFSCLCSLEFPESFDAPLPPLPPSLIILELKDQFNQPLALQYLPQLKHLAVGNCFNHPVNALAASLQVLHLGSSFNMPVCDLPRGLRQLVIANPNYSCRLDTLPQSLAEFATPLDDAKVSSTSVPHQKIPRSFSSRLTFKINNYRQLKGS